MKARLAYILAASHSGSTLLAMVLGSHPEATTVGELKFTALGPLERYRCSCREEIEKCPFWVGITRDVSARGFPFDLEDAGTDFHSIRSAYVRALTRPLHRGAGMEMFRDFALRLSPAWWRHYGRIQAKNAALVACIAERTGKRIVIDSSKIGIRLKYLLRNPDLDVTVVRLIRDGRAVALTYMDSARFADASDQNLRGGGMGIVGEHPRLTMEDAAWEWRRSNEEAEHALRGIEPSRVIEVRYEAFCRDTQGEASRIFSFLGLPPADALAHYGSANLHVIGNGMRLDATRQVKLDERWRDILSRKDLMVFNAVAGDLNRRLGYE